MQILLVLSIAAAGFCTPGFSSDTCSISNPDSDVQVLSQQAFRVSDQPATGASVRSQCFRSLTCSDRSTLAQITATLERDPGYHSLDPAEQSLMLYAVLLQVAGDSGSRLRSGFWQGEMLRIRSDPQVQLRTDDPGDRVIFRAVSAYRTQVESYLSEIERLRSLDGSDVLSLAVDVSLQAGMSSLGVAEQGTKTALDQRAVEMRAAARVLDSAVRSQLVDAPLSKKPLLERILRDMEVQNSSLGALTRLSGSELQAELNVQRAEVRVLGDLALTLSGAGGAGHLAAAVNGAGWAGLSKHGAALVDSSASVEGFWCAVAAKESQDQSPVLGTLSDLGGGAVAALGLTAAMGRLGSATWSRATKLAAGGSTLGVIGSGVVLSESERLARIASLDAAIESSGDPSQKQCLQSARDQAVAGAIFDTSTLLLGFTGLLQTQGASSVALGSAEGSARSRALAVAAEWTQAGRLSSGAAKRFVLEAVDLYHLESPAALRKLADLYDSIQRLPKGHFVERITPGASPGKVAIIGRGHDGVLNVEATLKARRPDLDIRTFHPTKEAMNEWQSVVDSIQRTRGAQAQLTREEVQATRLFRENTDWIARMRSEGVTILDVGNSQLQSTPGFFYEYETRFLYGEAGARVR